MPTWLDIIALIIAVLATAAVRYPLRICRWTSDVPSTEVSAHRDYST